MSGFQIPTPGRVVLQSGRPKMPVVDRRLVDQGCSVEAPIAPVEVTRIDPETLKAFPMRRLSLLVSEETGFTVAQIMSDRRTASWVKARQVLMWMGHAYTTLSLPQIGRVCGRDHTTVLHSTRKVEKIVRHYNLEMVESEREMIRALLQLDWTAVPR